MFVSIVLRELLTWRIAVHLKRLHLPILESDHSNDVVSAWLHQVGCGNISKFSLVEADWRLHPRATVQTPGPLFASNSMAASGGFLAETDYACHPR
jgi:hypothetical protein